MQKYMEDWMDQESATNLKVEKNRIVAPQKK